MTEQELCARMLTNFKEGDDDEYPQIFVIDDLLEAVLIAAIASLVGWLVRRCLDANFDPEKLNRLVRWSCKKASYTNEAVQLHLDSDGIYREHGARLGAAVVKTRNGLKRREMKQLQLSYRQRGSLEFPEDA